MEKIRLANINPRFLLLSIFTVSAASYVVTPLVPIYCIESLANGGLAWSRAEAFSTFGSFLALIYISPFFGGLIGDFIIGKPLTAILGYGMLLSGLVMLSQFTSIDGVSLALLAIALGIGFVKVTLTASIGQLPPEIQRTIYEYSYLASCLGFVCGGLFSNPLFTAFQIPGVIAIATLGTAISLLCFVTSLGRNLWRRSGATITSQPTQLPSSSPANPFSFFCLLFLGLPFFCCTNQLATGMPVFLHQCVNRTVASWTVPALWFGAIGSLAMAVAAPLLRRAWSARSFLQQIEPLKFSVGCAIIATAFALTSFFAAYTPLMAAGISIPFFLIVHAACFVADLHVRPVLFSAAASMIPSRYHTLSTAGVYACIGLGGKLAGTLASSVDAIGFSAIFAICSLLATLCGAGAFFWRSLAIQPSHDGLPTDDAALSS